MDENEHSMKHKKYHTVGTVQISNRKLVETANIDTPTSHTDNIDTPTSHTDNIDTPTSHTDISI
jgi:hypothetical protein